MALWLLLSGVQHRGHRARGRLVTGGGSRAQGQDEEMALKTPAAVYSIVIFWSKPSFTDYGNGTEKVNTNRSWAQTSAEGSATPSKPAKDSSPASPALGSTEELRRTHSLHGPCPVATLGPQACMM